jgi:hypothetical protein
MIHNCFPFMRIKAAVGTNGYICLDEVRLVIDR